jgi:hypothetical protein
MESTRTGGQRRHLRTSKRRSAMRQKQTALDNCAGVRSAAAPCLRTREQVVLRAFLITTGLIGLGAGEGRHRIEHMSHPILPPVPGCKFSTATTDPIHVTQQQGPSIMAHNRNGGTQS